MLYTVPVGDASYPPPPPGIALDQKVYLPGMFAEKQTALVCIVADECESLEVKTYANESPVYVTKDEGWYNMLWTANSFSVNGKTYRVLASGSVPDLYYLVNTPNPYSAYIILWMDEQWFYLGLEKE